MGIIRWEDPPRQSQGAGGGKWDDVRAELRGKQGEWAVLVDENTDEPIKVIAAIRSSFTLKDDYIIRVQNRFDAPIRLWIKYDPDEAMKRRNRTKPHQKK